MLAYWLLFAIIGFFSLLDYVKLHLPQFTKSILLFSLITVMVLFSGLRFDCDNDYREYARIYRDSPTISTLLSGKATLYDVYGEFLFAFLNILIKTLSAPVSVLFLTIAYITFLFLYKSITVLTISPFAALFLYVSMFFLAGGFTQIRFGAATTISWFAFAKLYRNEKRSCLMALIVACMFHIGAIVGFIVYYGMRFIKLNNKTVFFSVFIALFVASLNLSSIFVSFLSRFTGSIRYDSYLSMEQYFSKASSFGIYLYSIITLLFWFSRKYYKNYNETVFPFLMKICLITIVLGAFFIQVSILARFSVLLQMVFIFVIPMLCSINSLRYVSYLILILYGAFRYWQFFDPETAFIQEYNNVLFQ